MRAQLPASPDDIDLSALWARRQGCAAEAADRRRWRWAWRALWSCRCSRPKYASQAQIEIISKGVGNPFEPRRDTGAPEMVSVRMDKEAIATHVRALLSSDLALKLAAELHLAAKPEFNSALIERGVFGKLLQLVGLLGPRAGESDDDRVLTAYYDALRVYQVKDTRGIMIDFRSEDPKLAAELANRLAELYRDDLSLRTVLESRDARTKLEPQIRKLAEEVAQAEAEVTRFRGQANIFDGGRDRTGLNEQELSELTAELTRDGDGACGGGGARRTAREMMVRGTAEMLPDVQKSALVPRIVEQRVRVERQIAELSAMLLPAHPRMKQLNAELVGPQPANPIRGGRRSSTGSSARPRSRACARKASGAASRRPRSVWSVPAPTTSRCARSRASPNRSAPSSSACRCSSRSARTTSDASAVPVEVQIVSRARAIEREGLAQDRHDHAAGHDRDLLLGLVVRGHARAVRHGAIRSRFRASARARAASCSGPRDQAERRAIAARVRCRPMLARRLVAKAQGRAGFRTLVAGEAARDDAGKIAIELSRQLASFGRQTILLDWSLDGVGLAAELGVSPTLGITDVLSGRASFEDVIARLGGSEAHVIAAGSSVAGTAAAQDKDRVNMLLDALDDAYDHVVITGRRDAVRDLFTTIEGRIDAGVVVADGGGCRRYPATSSASTWPISRSSATSPPGGSARETELANTARCAYLKSRTLRSEKNNAAMSRRTTRILKAVLSALHYSGADSMIAPFTRGIGAIFMLHHISPQQARQVRAQPHPQGVAALPGAGDPPGARLRLRDRLARRGALPPDRGRLRQAVRLLHLRRRLPRQPRVRLPDLQAPSPAFRHLRADRLRRRPRRPVVAGAGEGHRPGRCAELEDGRLAASAALRHAGGEGRRIPHRLLVAQEHRRGRRARHRARAVQRHRLRRRQPLHRPDDELGGDRAAGEPIRSSPSAGTRGGTMRWPS